MTLEIDFETRSACDLLTEGMHRYFDDPTTQVCIASYSFDGGATVQRWKLGEPCPEAIQDHIESASFLLEETDEERWPEALAAAGLYTEAHNAAFEHGCFDWLFRNRAEGWPPVEPALFRCTAAMAAAMGLPRSLGDLGKALGLAQQKDDEGKKLIRALSLPQSRNPLRFNDDPALWARFHDYCDQDVRTEAEARKRLMPLSAIEQRVWVLDQRINNRGWRLDRESAAKALKLVSAGKADANQRLSRLTLGRVTSVDQTAELRAWMSEDCGWTMDSLAKQDVADALAHPGIGEAAKEALTIRQEAAKASLAKIPSMLARASDDGRIRGAFLYHGTAPGRWTSRGAQVHNLPRVRKVFEDAHPDINQLMTALRLGDPELLRLLYGPDLGQPLALLSDSIRSFLWAAPGHDLMVCDYSNIQGRIASWLGGDEWKLDAFRAADNKTGAGLYEIAAALIYGVSVTAVDKMMRQVGKVSELALGFQGGVGAFFNMSRGYGLQLDPMFGPVWASADEEAREYAAKRYEDCKKRGEATTKALSREAWIAADIVKAAWRKSNPGITAYWRTMNDAIHEAVENPGRAVPCGRVTYKVAGGFLWCRLPSGRCLAYSNPRIGDVEVPWSDKTVPPAQREKGRAVTVATVAGDGGLQRYALFGGNAFQNVVMAIETDLLRLGMFAVEAAGYPLVGHVHDELVAEVPRGFGSVEEFRDLMCQVPPWATGLPVVGAGWRGKRYRKA